MQSPDPIAQFGAEVKRIKTMADGSPRFEFEGGEDATRWMSVLADAQKEGYVYLMVFDFDEWMEYLRTQTGQR